MSQIPVTSTTLLREISGDALHARWGEFVARYRPMKEAFLRERFPYLEADDIIQETLIALVEKLPQYKYVPKETGYFHNYLTGVLKRKALRVCAIDKRWAEVMEDVQNEPPPPDTSSIEATEEQNWRESIYEIALEQVLADDSIQSRTKQIFLPGLTNLKISPTSERRCAATGETPLPQVCKCVSVQTGNVRW